jgi:hypothetical protein
LQPAQAASQVAVAPGSAGLIDVPQEEAVLHMAASSRASGVAPWVILGGGATLLTGLALLSWFALGLAPGALRPARAEVTRR